MKKYRFYFSAGKQMVEKIVEVTEDTDDAVVAIAFDDWLKSQYSACMRRIEEETE